MTPPRGAGAAAPSTVRRVVGHNRRSVARYGHRATIYTLLLLVAAFLVGAAWSLASPPASSPDEDFHLGSIWCPPPAASSGCTMTTLDGKPAVIVPAPIAQRPCYVGHRDDSAACQAALNAAPPTASTRFDQGEYPGPYFRFMHAFVGPSVDASVVVMRLVNVAIALAFVGAALALAPAQVRRVASVGMLAAMVPLAVFLVTSVNPSSWSIVGLTTLWIALASLALTRPGRRRLAQAALAVAGAGLAGAARADTGPFVVVMVATLAALFAPGRRGRAPQRAGRLDRLWLLAAGLALVAGGWSFFTAKQAEVGATVSTVGRDAGFVWGTNINEILLIPAGILGVGPFGTLGWVEIALPSTVYVPTLALAGYLLIAGLGALDRRKAGALALVGGALLVLPFYMLTRNLETVGIQPRYFIALLPLLLALAALAPGAASALRLTRTQAWFAWTCVTVAHAFTLATAMRRYVTGLPGTFAPGFPAPTGAFWWWTDAPNSFAAPPVLAVWIVGCLAYAFVASVLVRGGVSQDAPASGPEVSA